jgi:AraC-like DNA-binding protein
VAERRPRPALGTRGAGPLPAPAPLPAATARAVLAGFGALGLDAEGIRREAGLSEAELAPFDGLVAGEAFGRLWEAAGRRAPRETLVTEAGLAIPFGAFGPLDYLAGSSPDLESALHALEAHFRQVATQFGLEVQAGEHGVSLRITCREPSPGRASSDEFTLAVMVGRFRRTAGVAPRAVRQTRQRPSDPARFERLLGVPAAWGCALAEVQWPAAARRAPMRGADPALLATLRELAGRLELGAARTDLEAAVRARLRAALPDRGAPAPAVARALGLSGRTLQRRLAAEGVTFRDLVDRFREEEAERLLDAGALALSEVALRLGFSDQTAWNRAFRRWKGSSPSEWLAGRRGGAPPAPPSGRSRRPPPPPRT